MPANGCFYIFLSVHASKQFICPFIGLLNDCYIHNTSSFDSLVVAFSFALYLKHINDRDSDF